MLLGDHPEMFFRETGKKFTDKYGDRSGIIMWGYDAEKKMWTVKQKSGRIEYYERKVDFMSWTKVDLSELIHAPFHNPTNDTMAWSFKNFLEIKAKNNFEDLKTFSSFTKKAKGVIDPHTNKTMGTATVVIKLKKNQFRIVDPKDLLKFGEHDIHTLSNFQTIIENELFEAVVKDFNGMVATIIDKKLWAGAFDQANLHLVEKP
uniref:Uncharacterized protein n=1 Tax=Lactuca sativa TaxID=4236 RepID=A0A9R1WN11_LACSA|nr:hypothetical protein LSAT_V11C100048600 [Lactuca sativa]